MNDFRNGWLNKSDLFPHQGAFQKLLKKCLWLVWKLLFLLPYHIVVTIFSPSLQQKNFTNMWLRQTILRSVEVHCSKIIYPTVQCTFCIYPSSNLSLNLAFDKWMLKRLLFRWNLQQHAFIITKDGERKIRDVSDGSSLPEF